MKIFRKLLDIIVKVASSALAILVTGIVGMMLIELCARNFFNTSFRFSTELCGFLFMWMAFLGVIVLFDREALISLDIVYRSVPAMWQKCFWYISKVFSIGLGITMIIAYCGMYKINSTSYFSTMQFLSKAWHFLPMALAGGFIALDSVYQILNRLISREIEQV